MNFSSEPFLFVFLPFFFLLYYLTPNRFKNYTVLAGSFVFYIWGAPLFIYLLAASITMDYYISKFLSHKNQNKSKRILFIGISLNLVLLGYMKYANFFVHEINGFMMAFANKEISWVPVVLPIGISFVTFQKISYLVDVYNRKVDAAESLINYMLYIMLFPQLIAGPIVRYHDINEQIRIRTHSFDAFTQGLFRFCTGLAKKILIADQLGQVADKIFCMAPASMTLVYAWLGICCYTFQIYFDFSGYSDMAIGLARMMGFDLLENFNRPYISRSITEFWRRWHISLSRWMKEYLYIPLGGNRKGAVRGMINLWLVFILSGLWHGAQWTFIVWGIYHGLFLTLDKLFFVKLLNRLPRFFSTALTFFIIMMGWVFFRSDTIKNAWEYFGYLSGTATVTTSNILMVDVMNNRSMVVLFIAVLFSFVPSFKISMVLPYLDFFSDKIRFSLRGMMALFLFILSISALLNSSFHPFLYFKF